MQMAQTSTVNNIVGQARQGSVAAIIQVLNEQLADVGIRTRAILADGILELLCEASTAEQLSQTDIVNRVQTILESLAPRHIRKVNISSRIVREQQLLWLEEITRDPENQLLWSELITLKQLNPIRRLWQDLRQSRKPVKIVVPESKRNRLKQRYFLRGVIGGASLCLLLLLVGWTLKHRLGIFNSQAKPVDEIQPPVERELGSSTSAPDSFVQAVRLAEQAAIDGQTAVTAAAWLDLATRWQRASDLMAEVSPDDPRYTTARDRVSAYQQNRQQALLRADRLQQTENASPLEADVE